jgi:hypothetical protein
VGSELCPARSRAASLTQAVFECAVLGFALRANRNALQILVAITHLQKETQTRVNKDVQIIKIEQSLSGFISSRGETKQRMGTSGV